MNSVFVRKSDEIIQIFTNQSRLPAPACGENLSKQIINQFCK